MTMFRIPPRIAALSAAVLLLGVAACSDEPDPIGPELGVDEQGTASGFLTPGTPVNTFGFAANRTGTVFVRVCGETGSNVDIAATTNTRRVSGVQVADTLGKAASAGVGACETLQVAATGGRTYRIVITPAEKFGQWSACFSYTEGDCASTAAVDYYAGITAGLTGQQLITALGQVTRAGQRTFQYDSARGWLYQSVEDADSNDVVTDLYVGRSATVIRRSLDGADNDAGDANFNAEHAWPQSCGARAESSSLSQPNNGSRGDLHILFAADAPANSQRSNFPFGIVTGTPTYTSTPPTGVTEVSRRGPGAGGTVFEPRPSKRGDIARAIFYYYVRYVAANPAGASLANFAREEATLRQWHIDDPVDASERARNDVIYLVQRNRNPFVDRPELVAQVGTFPTTVAGTAASCNF